MRIQHARICMRDHVQEAGDRDNNKASSVLLKYHYTNID